MAKPKSQKLKKERASKYDEKLSVNGSFLDIMKAAAKHANNKSKTNKPS